MVKSVIFFTLFKTRISFSRNPTNHFLTVLAWNLSTLVFVKLCELTSGVCFCSKCGWWTCPPQNSCSHRVN